MRAVWTFWSRPFQLRQRFAWLNERYHLLAWVLSVETARNHYPDTALYTDDEGAQLLIDGLGLQFQQVSTALNILAGHDPLLWALGKIYTYRLQTTPFVHLDNDVFLWKRLPARMETAPLLAQNPEHFIIGESHYKPQAFVTASNGAETIGIPTEWKWYYAERKQSQRGEACGIFGGNHIEFINCYADLAIWMAEHPANTSIWSLLSGEAGTNNACGLFEEYLLSACIEYHQNTATSPYRNIGIEYLFGSMAEAYNAEHAARAGYTHLIGDAKKNRLLCDRLEQRVLREHPEHYERCLKFEHARSMPRYSDKPPILMVEAQTPTAQQSPARTAPAGTGMIAPEAPRMVFVELSQHCNLACSMCRPEGNIYQQHVMSDATFQQVSKKLFPEAELIDLRGFGESLLLDTFPERARAVVEHGSRLRIVTNLSFRAEASLEALAAANAHVAISLDTVDEHILRLVRRGARLSLILNNIQFLRNAYARHGSNFQRVYIGATIQQLTIGRLSQLVTTAARQGITEVRFFARMDSGKQFSTDIVDRSALLRDLEECQRLADSYGICLRVGMKLWPDMKDDLPPYDFPCLRPWTYCFVTWEGRIGFCDFLIGPCCEKHTFGNIMEEEFDAIWNGEKWQELRCRHLGGDLEQSEVSSQCAWCYRNRYVDFEEQFDTQYQKRILTPESILRTNQ